MPCSRQGWCLVHSQGTWRCTCVALPRETLTLRVRFPAGAGGGAQAGSARAADGEEAGTISVLSVLGASSPPDFSSVRKKEKSVLCACWLLSSCLCSPCQGMDPGNHLCPPQLCLHIWSYSCLVFAIAGFKKRISNESRHQLIHKTQVSSRRCQPQLESIPSASQGSCSRPLLTHVSFQLLLLVFRGSCILGLVWGERRRGEGSW